MDTLSIEGSENCDVFADDVSDETLEIAAGSGDCTAMGVTLAACTNIWSTFCNMIAVNIIAKLPDLLRAK